MTAVEMNVGYSGAWSTALNRPDTSSYPLTVHHKLGQTCAQRSLSHLHALRPVINLQRVDGRAATEYQSAAVPGLSLYPKLTSRLASLSIKHLNLLTSALLADMSEQGPYQERISDMKT